MNLLIILTFVLSGLIETTPDSTYTVSDYNFYKSYGKDSDVQNVEKYFKYLSDSIAFAQKMEKHSSYKPNAVIVKDGVLIFKYYGKQKRTGMTLNIGDSVYVQQIKYHRSFILYLDDYGSMWRGYIGSSAIGK